MMDREQYLLTKLAEECTELAQITLKTQQFGRDERYPKSKFNNRERMTQEFNDLLGIIDMLNSEFQYCLSADIGLIEAKREKVNHYYNYSIECGMVS